MSDRFPEADRIFRLAIDREPAERAPFLKVTCGDDSTLLREVESLLRADAVFHPLLDRPSFEIGLAEGDRVGPYRVERRLGEGGMSVVWLAVRDDDRYRKKVAIKVLKAALPGRSLLARFRTECQILAGLDHPGIARLLDAGSLANGVPYVVMEHVDGERLDDYCDRHRLTVVQRLALVRKVLAAAQYAHRHLVVHRDLKPGNILVNAEGAPKLLDFGIAKLLAPGEAGGNAEVTVTGLRPMTPEYASPEQLQGGPMTTAVDVYSLGVVLFKLLTGRLPFRLEGPSLAEIERFLAARAQPPRPSAAVDGTRRRPEADAVAAAAARGTTPEQLRRRLRGDLDNIVLKALRPAPGERYGSAEELSEDIGRHLEGRPVRARRGTLLYRAGKLVRRRRLSLVAAAVLLLSVAGFAVSWTIQAQRVRRERDRAQQVLSFFVDLFEVADPSESLSRSVSARDLLDRGAKRAAVELKDSPDTLATLLDTMGVVYRGLGAYGEARTLGEQGLAIRRSQLGSQHPDVAASLHNLAATAAAEGDFSRSEKLFREALAQRRRLLGKRDPAVAETLEALAGTVLAGREDYAEAEALAREALAIQRAVYPPPHRKVADSLSGLGEIVRNAGRLAEADSLLRQALAMRRKLFGEIHPDVAESLQTLGDLEYDQDRYGEAETSYRQALAIHRKLYHGAHPALVGSLAALARDLEAQGKTAEAEALFEQAVALQRRFTGEHHPEFATLLGNFAMVYLKQGDPAKAEALLRRALAIRRETLGEQHLMVALSRHALAYALHARGALEEAEGLYRQADAGFTAALPPGHPYRIGTKVNLGRLLVDRGQPAAGETFLRQGLAMARAAFPADHWRVATAEVGLGRCLTAEGRFAEAEDLLTRGYSALVRSMGEKHAWAVRARANLAALYRAWGKPEEARRWETQAAQREARKARDRSPGGP